MWSAERARKARFRAFFGRNPQTAELWTGGAPIKGGYYCRSMTKGFDIGLILLEDPVPRAPMYEF